MKDWFFLKTVLNENSFLKLCIWKKEENLKLDKTGEKLGYMKTNFNSSRLIEGHSLDRQMAFQCCPRSVAVSTVCTI